VKVERGDTGFKLRDQDVLDTFMQIEMATRTTDNHSWNSTSDFSTRFQLSLSPRSSPQRLKPEDLELISAIAKFVAYDQKILFICIKGAKENGKRNEFIRLQTVEKILGINSTHGRVFAVAPRREPMTRKEAFLVGNFYLGSQFVNCRMSPCFTNPPNGPLLAFRAIFLDNPELKRALEKCLLSNLRSGDLCDRLALMSALAVSKQLHSFLFAPKRRDIKGYKRDVNGPRGTMGDTVGKLFQSFALKFYGAKKAVSDAQGLNVHENRKLIVKKITSIEDVSSEAALNGRAIKRQAGMVRHFPCRGYKGLRQRRIRKCSPSRKLRQKVVPNNSAVENHSASLSRRSLALIMVLLLCLAYLLYFKRQ